jgi:hypothetical protein
LQNKRVGAAPDQPIRIGLVPGGYKDVDPVNMGQK